MHLKIFFCFIFEIRRDVFFFRKFLIVRILYLFIFATKCGNLKINNFINEISNLECYDIAKKLKLT